MSGTTLGGSTFRRRRLSLVAVWAVILASAGAAPATAGADLTSPWTGRWTPVAPIAAQGPLTWAPPDTSGYSTLPITAPGTYNLYANVDYVVSAPARIDGAVHLRGGRNVVWVGGHISIPHQGPGPVRSSARRGLVISDIDAGSGDPSRYGVSPAGRVVHIEGLLIDGPDLAEGVNTNAPAAVVQLENIRVERVHFRNSDDRDGTNGWARNHPDILQTWGSQRELRVDGLSGSSAYQGLYLQEDGAGAVKGPMYLRRVNLRAYEQVGDDGYPYAGHRMLTWVQGAAGRLVLDAGTVWVAGHPNSGWNAAAPNPSPDTSFWRVRYWSALLGRHVTEPPPGGAGFLDALGGPPGVVPGVDALGQFAEWPLAPIVDWQQSRPGRVYAGTPAQGDYVPLGVAGLSYRSPGYAAAG